jgi:uncharacterized membrane protein HdeD (DUF308 family)
MRFAIRFGDHHLPAFGNNWRWFLLWGIGLIVLGLLAISAATFTTLLSVILLGMLIFFSGVIMLVDSFSFWRKKNGFFIHLLVAILYLVVGMMLIKNPVEGAISLTLLLSLFYIFLGVFRIATSAVLQLPRWGWVWLNGVVTLILGILIMMTWPATSSLFVIGLFVGIDLVFLGWTYVMLGLAGRNMRLS